VGIVSEVVLVQTGQETMVYLVRNFLGGASLYLWSVNVVPNFDTQLADLPVETIGGVTTRAVGFMYTPMLDQDGQWNCGERSVAEWTATGPDIGKTIYGWAMLNAAGDLIWAERFDTPVFIVEANQGILILARYAVPALASSGAVMD
jgi:hypothetical protein